MFGMWMLDENGIHKNGVGSYFCRINVMNVLKPVEEENSVGIILQC